MGELIQFPKREPEAIQIEGLAPVDFSECQDIVHVFDEVPGTCRCGERTWTTLPEPDFIGIHEAS